MTQRGSLREASGLAGRHLWPRCDAPLQIESANVIFPSDFKPDGRAEFNLLLSERPAGTERQKNF